MDSVKRSGTPEYFLEGKIKELQDVIDSHERISEIELAKAAKYREMKVKFEEALKKLES